MANPFLSSEEYDERAHRLYNDGDYDAALDTLKEGLSLYPNSVELYVGLGYARLARDEFVWAKQAFEKALVLDGDHEDALVGLGEVLLRLGRQADALRLFERARDLGGADDLDLLLSMGRALYREKLFNEAREVFAEAVSVRPDSAEAVSALAYTLHRLGDEAAARRQLRRALKLDSEHHEARIYLAHLLYDRGDWEGALDEFEHVPASDHWDPVAIWRLLELKRALLGVDAGHPELATWEDRLQELEVEPDAVDELLAELESGALEPSQLDLFAENEASSGPPGRPLHRVRGPDGKLYAGSWVEIVRQLRDASGRPHESVAQFMRRQAAEQRARNGVSLPTDDPEAFLLASARAGLIRIER